MKLLSIAYFCLSVSAFIDESFGVNTSHKKNVIFIVTDGMGPAALSLARSFKQLRDGNDDEGLFLDKYVVGTIRTKSSDSLVTDSAAAATAYACGLKSYNGAIGVTPDKKACGTVLEALKLQGYKTGLVVTTRITDATPAAFSAHVSSRKLEADVAEQQLFGPLGQTVDLILGGGRTYFYSSSGGSRKDGRNLIDEAKEKGWSYVGNKAEFDQLDSGKNVSLPLLGLLANKDIPYAIDRDENEYPSLAEQVKVALTALEKATEDSEKGFFLLIESSRIDHAGHDNDAAAHVREVLAYDDALKEVVAFVDNAKIETTVIATSDHETGGLAAARQVGEDYEYLWYPQVLLNATHSGEYLAKKILDFTPSKSDADIKEFLEQDVISGDLGIVDFTDDEVNKILSLVKEDDSTKLLEGLNDLVSIRSLTGWSTHGHTATDVNLYAYTNSKAVQDRIFSNEKDVGFLGSHENTEVADFFASLTGVNLEDVTKKLTE